jgi:hypothetical protein
VDFSEKRKASEKFEMNDPMYHDYYKIVMKTMKKGDICWVRFSQQYHGGTYFNTQYYLQRSQEEKDSLGEYVYIKFTICQIKRNPLNLNAGTY